MCVKIDGKAVVKDMARHWLRLRDAAAADGVTLYINDGFRTMKKQKYYWNCYQTQECNGGRMAAFPGTSNHQQGTAWDIGGCKYPDNDQAKGWGFPYYWLRQNAWKYGFMRTVSSERWHWEYKPGERCKFDCQDTRCEQAGGTCMMSNQCASGETKSGMCLTNNAADYKCCMPGTAGNDIDMNAEMNCNCTDPLFPCLDLNSNTCKMKVLRGPDYTTLACPVGRSQDCTTAAINAQRQALFSRF